MANYKEIVTKAIIGKGKKSFTTDSSIVATNNPTTILGCWVINHNFAGVKNGDTITINGSYDVNIWYSYDKDTKTEVIRNHETYSEHVKMHDREDSENEEIIVRNLKQPSCSKVEIDGNKINYTIDKELGVELVGDIKVKIEANMDEDPWDEIEEEKATATNTIKSTTNIENIDDKINDQYLN